MGGTVSTVKIHAEQRSLQKRGEAIIPLKGVGEQLRIFQHHTGGDLVILLNDDAPAFLAEPTSHEYDELFVSRRGHEYFNVLADKVTQSIVLEHERRSGATPAVSLFSKSLSQTSDLLFSGGSSVADKSSSRRSSRSEISPLNSANRMLPPINQDVKSLATTASATALSTKLREKAAVPARADTVSPRPNAVVLPALSQAGAGAGAFADGAPAAATAGAGSTVRKASVMSSTSVSTIESKVLTTAEIARSGSEAAGGSTLDAALTNSSDAGSEGDAVAYRTFQPAAYLPPSEQVRKRIFEEEKKVRRSAENSRSNSNNRINIDTGAANTESGSPAPTSPLSNSASYNQGVIGGGGGSAKLQSPSFGWSSSGDDLMESSSREQSGTHNPNNQKGRINPNASVSSASIATLLPQHSAASSQLRSSTATVNYIGNSFSTTPSTSGHALFNPGAAAGTTGSFLPMLGSPRGSASVATAVDGRPPLGSARTPSESPQKMLGAGQFNFASTDGTPPRHHNGAAAATGGTMQPPLTARLVVCPICGVEVRPEPPLNGRVSSPPLTRESPRVDASLRNSTVYEGGHIQCCQKRNEMKELLMVIDKSLEPHLIDLNESARRTAERLTQRALERARREFLRATAVHGAARKVIRSIMRVTYDTSPAKIAMIEQAVADLRERIAPRLLGQELNELGDFSSPMGSPIKHMPMSASAASGSGSAASSAPVNMLHDELRRTYLALNQVIDHASFQLAKKQAYIEKFKDYLIGVRDFVFVRKLGRGAFANVYLARGVDCRQFYAVKVFDKKSVQEQDLLDRVMKERIALANASKYSDYFVKLHYAFQTSTHLFMVMDYLEGGDCLMLMENLDQITEIQAQHIIFQVCLALKHLHSHGVIHRDIKPDNVLLSAKGHARLGDFGSVGPIHPDFLPGAKERKAALAQASVNGSSSSSSMFDMNGGHIGGHFGQYMNDTQLAAIASLALRENPNVVPIGGGARIQPSHAVMMQMQNSPLSNTSSRSYWFEEEFQDVLDLYPHRDSGAAAVTTGNESETVLGNQILTNHPAGLWASQGHAAESLFVPKTFGRPSHSEQHVVIEPSESHSGRSSSDQSLSFGRPGHQAQYQQERSAEYSFTLRSTNLLNPGAALHANASLPVPTTNSNLTTRNVSLAAHSTATASTTGVTLNAPGNGGLAVVATGPPKPLEKASFEIIGNYFYATPESTTGMLVMSPAMDWWSVGVLLFHLLAKCTPFEGLTKATTLENIEQKNIDWNILPHDTSSECRQFLKDILLHGYETRLGHADADEVVMHKFFRNIDHRRVYEGLAPLYPRVPRASDEWSPDFYTFSVLPEKQQMQEIPDFVQLAEEANRKNTATAGSAAAPVTATTTLPSIHPSSPRGGESKTNNNTKPQPAKGGDLFQDFNYHPF